MTGLGPADRLRMTLGGVELENVTAGPETVSGRVPSSFGLAGYLPPIGWGHGGRTVGKPELHRHRAAEVCYAR